MTQRPSLIGSAAGEAGAGGTILGVTTTAAGVATGADGVSCVRTGVSPWVYAYTIPDNGLNYTVNVTTEFAEDYGRILNKTATGFEVKNYTAAGSNVIRAHTVSIIYGA